MSPKGKPLSPTSNTRPSPAGGPARIHGCPQPASRRRLRNGAAQSGTHGSRWRVVVRCRRVDLSQVWPAPSARRAPERGQSTKTPPGLPADPPGPPQVGSRSPGGTGTGPPAHPRGDAGNLPARPHADWPLYLPPSTGPGLRRRTPGFRDDEATCPGVGRGAWPVASSHFHASLSAAEATNLIPEGWPGDRPSAHATIRPMLAIRLRVILVSPDQRLARDSAAA